MEQFNPNTKKAKLKRFWKETIRVFRITRRPNKEEYLTATKVTGLGIAVIGPIGLIIFLLKQLLF